MIISEKNKKTIIETLQIILFFGIFAFIIAFLTVKSIDKDIKKDCGWRSQKWRKHHRNICPKDLEPYEVEK